MAWPYPWRGIKHMSYKVSNRANYFLKRIASGSSKLVSYEFYFLHVANFVLASHTLPCFFPVGILVL
jgi:hypothetical protein